MKLHSFNNYSMTLYQRNLFLALTLAWSFTLANSSPGIAGYFINNLIFPKKCLKDLGCFSNGPPFYHPILRPISLLPWDLKDFKTKFYLYNNPDSRTLLEPNKESLAKSGYNKDLGLRFFIHGFKMQWNEENLKLVESFMAAMQKEEKSNSILVDWTDSNQDPYPQAVANGRVVGAQTAQLVKFLQENTGLDPKKVYIIGHSLGTHVSGWAGERIPELGRITGLDPAGPYFRRGSREDPNKLRGIRLDDSDADYVDILHTNAADFVSRGLGIKEDIGDLDVYPNGGTLQPGCEPTLLNISIAGMDLIIKGSDGLTANLGSMCNHVRAVLFFMASIDNSECQFTASQCEDFEKYRWGRCKSNKKAEMGFHSKKDPSLPVRTRMFLETSDKYPFCIKK